ncbi:MAG: class I tRNA ligase family protein, partial [Erysipelotrichaceae bacterium]
VERAYTELDKITLENDHSLDKIYHATVKKVTHDIETLNFNTAVSQMMIFINEVYKAPSFYREYAQGFIQMFACFAPHLGEELYQHLTKQAGISFVPWPAYDEAYLKEDQVEIVVQINGKIRTKVWVAVGSSQVEVEALAYKDDNLKAHLVNLSVRKVIFVKDRLLNLVV